MWERQLMAQLFLGLICISTARAESLSASVSLLRGGCPKFEYVNVNAFECGNSPVYGEICVINPTPGSTYNFSNTNENDIFCTSSWFTNGLTCPDNSWSPYFISDYDEPTEEASNILWRDGYQINNGVDIGYVPYASSGNSINTMSVISTSGANDGRAFVITSAEALEFFASIDAPVRNCNTPSDPQLYATNGFSYTADIDTNITFYVDPSVHPVGSTIDIPFTLEIQQRTDKAIVNLNTNAIIRDLNVNTLANVQLKSNSLGGNASLNGSFSFTFDGNPYVVNLIWKAGNSRLLSPPKGVILNPFITDDVARFKFGSLPPGVSCEGINFAIDSCAPQSSEISIQQQNIAPQIAQTVYDPDIGSDGVFDLVANRQIAVFTEISLDSGQIATPVDVRAEITDQSGTVLSDKTIKVAFDPGTTKISLNPDHTQQLILNIPDVEGDYKLKIQVDPDSLITGDDPTNNIFETPVYIHKTKKLSLKYAYITPKACKFTIPPSGLDCHTSVNNINILNTISDANKLIQNIFPIPNNGVITSPTIYNYDNGDSLLSDIWAVWVKSWDWNFKRTIGLVADGYFNHYGYTDTVGMEWSNNLPVLSSIGLPENIAHEIGHTFGFGEGYTTKIVNGISVLDSPGANVFGYNIEEKKEINAREIMGASGSNKYWISYEHWIDLIQKLKISTPDPELLLIGATIRKDGSLTLLPWFVTEGIPRPISYGNYTILLKDEKGEIIENTAFDVKFTVFNENLGKQDIDEDLITLAIPYTMAASTVEIIGPDSTVLTIIDPAKKTIHDGFDSIQDSCFAGDVTESRNAITALLSQFDSLLSEKKYHDIVSLLETEMMSFAENFILPECSVESATKISQQKLINLITKTIPHLEARIVTTDIDGDGIFDDQDVCPESDISNTIVIRGCDSGVPNIVQENGCSLTDDILSCENPDENHGLFVSCISQLTNVLKKQERISNQDKGNIQNCAGQTNK